MIMKRRSNQTKSQQSRSNRPESSEMEGNPLHKLFLEEIADVYNAEEQLIKALPKMASAAQSDELREAFESHLEETQQHAERLEELVKSVGGSIKRKKCKAMEGLIAEAKEMMEEHEGEPELDAVLIAGAQKVEHYEIASYGTLCAWAEQMGHTDALENLKETLGEEKAADEKLTEIAESVTNQNALTAQE